MLDVLHRLQATQAGDLAMRWNCKAGQVRFVQRRDQRPTQAAVHDPAVLVAAGPGDGHPAAHLPGDPGPGHRRVGQLRQGPADPVVHPAGWPGARRATGWPRSTSSRSQEFRKCIECWLCQDVCHVIRDHEDNKPAYAGPRFFIRHAELDMHPLDTLDRRSAARDEQGLGLCNITKCCTEVCPARASRSPTTRSSR